ncbi:unnamed protein product [Protopolystoma xenopodis]|uniref:Uncharacterized protein n=1 Tax=Protopolystoma xenopodis TaxID=117903 RepID=A0A3S5B195_9PLAT|nr:unnamed protein product [Protopolystoma xenopodis]
MYRRVGGAACDWPDPAVPGLKAASSKAAPLPPAASRHGEQRRTLRHFVVLLDARPSRLVIGSFQGQPNSLARRGLVLRPSDGDGMDGPWRVFTARAREPLALHSFCAWPPFLRASDRGSAAPEPTGAACLAANIRRRRRRHDGKTSSAQPG